MLAIPVPATRSLAPSMTAHALVDVVLGMGLGPLARRWGLAGGSAARD